MAMVSHSSALPHQPPVWHSIISQSSNVCIWAKVSTLTPFYQEGRESGSRRSALLTYKVTTGALVHSSSLMPALWVRLGLSLSLLNQCKENGASPNPSTHAGPCTLLTSESNWPQAFPRACDGCMYLVFMEDESPPNTAEYEKVVSQASLGSSPLLSMMTQRVSYSLIRRGSPASENGTWPLI